MPSTDTAGAAHRDILAELVTLGDKLEDANAEATLLGEAVDEYRHLTRQTRAALDLVIATLTALPDTCRYHGDRFDSTGPFECGLPRCDSCKSPYRITTALAEVRAVLAELDRVSPA